jgi:thiol-disulfide isomerase/thioredoxin
MSARADETEEYNKIRTLLSGGKLEEAEKAYEAALADYPGSSRLESMGYMFYLYADRDGKHDVALKYLEKHVDGQVAKLADNPRLVQNLPYYVDLLLAAYPAAGKSDAAGGKLDAIVAAVEKAAEGGDANLALGMRDLRNKQITLRAESNQDEARKLLASRLAAVQKALEAKPDDTAARLDRLYLLKAESELLESTSTDQAGAARDKFLAELLAAAKEHTGDVPLVVAAIDNYSSAAGELSRKNAYTAEKLLASIKEFAAKLETKDDVIAGRLDNLERMAASLERAITAGKVHADLLGKDALPLTAEAWVNGAPISADELKGKVVLLDFWAVWCGPCIATFPHLREWQEKYADKGLVIIGVTRYYKYGWNDEAKRPERAEELSPEDEQAAMIKFALHHQLTHRFMVTPADSKLQAGYGVTGIPQAVLIDRAGKVRLIRVGSGEANARDLDRLLAELIEDKAGE